MAKRVEVKSVGRSTEKVELMRTPFLWRTHFCTTNLNMVIFRPGNLYSLCSQDYQKILHFNFFLEKGRNRPIAHYANVVFLFELVIKLIYSWLSNFWLSKFVDQKIPKFLVQKWVSLIKKASYLSLRTFGYSISSKTGPLLHTGTFNCSPDSTST